MPKPYVCVACEKVIIEQAAPGSPPEVTGGVASLIGLFNKIMAFSTVEEKDIPSNAVVPKEWAVFSSWDIEAADKDHKYDVCMQIYYPDGSPFGPKGKSVLTVEPGKRAQNMFKIMGFPIGQVGHYKVHTWVEEAEKTVYGPIEFEIGLEIIKQTQGQVVL